MKVKRIALVGGGTAGHVLPLLLLAGELAKRKVELFFLHSINPRDRRLIREHPFGRKFRFRTLSIPTGKWRRYFDIRNFSDLLLTAAGFLFAFFFFLFNRPSLVLLKGGFVGVPVGLAAFFLRIPIVLHESDSVMGQANRFLSRFAKKIAVSFPLNTYRSLSPLLRHKLIYTGLPISNEFRTISPFRHHATPPALLVTGGSQGARQINNLIVGVLPKLLNKYRLIHLSGELDYPHLAEIRHQLPKALQESYELYPFKPLSEALPQADLVVSRAGATTLFELAAAGKPAILIPLPHSANHHQEKNAQFFADHKAALLLRGRETTPSKLLSLIQRLLKGNQERRALSHQIKTLDQREAVKKLTQLVLE